MREAERDLEGHFRHRPIWIGRCDTAQLRQEVVLIEDCPQQLLLGLEVVVQQALRDAGRVRQVLDGGAVETLGGKDLQRGGQELGAALLGLLAASSPPACSLNVHSI